MQGSAVMRKQLFAWLHNCYARVKCSVFARSTAHRPGQAQSFYDEQCLASPSVSSLCPGALCTLVQGSTCSNANARHALMQLLLREIQGMR